MGYRSEVAVALRDSATRLLLTVTSQLPREHEVHSLIFDGLCQTGSTDIVKSYKDPNVDCECKMHWEHLKWYDSYKCVGFIENFLTQIDSENYRFVRIGEETEDIEEHGDYYDSDLYISRAISW